MMTPRDGPVIPSLGGRGYVKWMSYAPCGEPDGSKDTK